MSKRAWKRVNQEAERRGAIILPRDEERLATERARLPADPRDKLIRQALARVEASLARSREWIAERSGTEMDAAFAEGDDGLA